MDCTKLALTLVFLAGTAAAQQLDQDFTIIEDDQAAGCAGSIVSGLDPNGDGFLSVRTGPGSQFSKIDELHNGDLVRTCTRDGKWYGVYYGQPRRKGWVHGNWLIDGAG
ncbi:SH3 domain-containing protein [Ruegeria meonggei]|uniref:Bacterial SH3 domain protein n=1 Tax=Ruegeria meonggei TaxID=1446476 RepID=A0A1X6ZA30_9RHOB|nr:SH3 domain-containing protein [Ruegeria meonggei]SLN45863.1 Bacterial SH3 domain protein [Ruegeria meonggei]